MTALRIYVRISIFLILITTLQAGEIDSTGYTNIHSMYGVFIQYDINNHYSDFRALPGVPNCCPRFTHGYGSGIGAGLSYNHFFNDDLSSKLSLSYNDFSGNFKAEEKTVVGFEGRAVDGIFEHRLETSLGMLLIEHYLSYRASGPLRISLGITGGITVLNNYYQIEKITKPDGLVTFLDENGNPTGSFTRNEKKGVINSITGFNFFLTGGFSYELPMNRSRTLFLVPGIYYSYSLTPMVRNYTWRLGAIRAGFSIQYTNYSKPGDEDEYEEPFVSDTIIVVRKNTNPPDTANPELIHKDTTAAPSAEITGRLRITGITGERENDNGEFLIEEFLSLNMKPLLQYIFFSYDSSSIPGRYNLLSREQAKAFSLKELLNKGTLETYYDILNILGYRLKNAPGVKITLTGCNSDNGAERNNRSLSRSRAESVKDYLVNTWGIDSDRIETESRGLPQRASNNNYENGKEENRRVEISSDNTEILDPVITNDTLVVITPKTLRLYPELDADKQVDLWLITISCEGKVLQKYSGRNKLPQYLDWNIDENVIPRSGAPVTYNFQVLLKGDRKIHDFKDTIPFDIKTVGLKRLNKMKDKKIDNYSLILFQYNTAAFTKENMKIADFIKKNIKPASTIYITGYTDETGDDEYNIRLSEKRARSLKEILSPLAFERGLGKSVLLYDNMLPEGRFYSRTVIVKVETPIN